MCGSVADIQFAAAEIRRGKKEEEEERTNHSMKIYMVSLFHRATINKYSNVKKQRKLNYEILTTRLLQNLQKPFTVELCRNMNLSCFFTNTARQVYSKVTQTIFNYIDAPSFKKFHTETVKGAV